jgi:membrane protease YdiL (CAAX protease family)
MASPGRTTTTAGEAIAIMTICFGWPAIASILSAGGNFHSAAFTDASFISLIVMEVVCAAIALSILRARGYAIASLYPAPSPRGVGVGALLYATIGLASFVLTTLFVPATNLAAQPITKLMQNASVSLPIVVLLGLVNGVYEEVFLLGFLLRGLRGHGLLVALGASLLVRVLCHLYQGPLGVISIVGFGLVLGIYYIRSNRLFPAVFAHALCDIVPFVFFFWN